MAGGAAICPPLRGLQIGGEARPLRVESSPDFTPLVELEQESEVLLPAHEAVAASRDYRSGTRLMLAVALAVSALAVLAVLLFLWAASPRTGSARAPSGIQTKTSGDFRLAEEVLGLSEVGVADFTCERFGCMDIRSPSHPCQCNPNCEEEGTCCKDYQDVCLYFDDPPSNPRLGTWEGCQGARLPSARPGIFQYAPAGPALKVKVMTYNGEWWHVIEQLGGNNNGVAQVILDAERPVPIDFLCFQEFYDPWFGLTRPGGVDGNPILSEYIFLRGEVGGPAGTIIGFRRAFWNLVERGQQYVAEDQKQVYWGKRIVLWARLQHKQTGKMVFVANHHGPLPVGTGGVCGGAETGYNILRAIADHAQPGDAILFVGDFNADSTHQTMQVLAQSLLSFFTNIDHILTNLPSSAVVSQAGVGSGGSDHSALTLEVDLPAGPGQPTQSPAPIPFGSSGPAPAPAAGAAASAAAAAGAPRCGQEGSDPYAGGSHVACCSGLQECPAAGPQRRPLCMPSCAPAPSQASAPAAAIPAMGLPHLELSLPFALPFGGGGGGAPQPSPPPQQQDACTSQGMDPYHTGDHRVCCGGLQECLVPRPGTDDKMPLCAPDCRAAQTCTGINDDPYAGGGPDTGSPRLPCCDGLQECTAAFGGGAEKTWKCLHSCPPARLRRLADLAR